MVWEAIKDFGSAALGGIGDILKSDNGPAIIGGILGGGAGLAGLFDNKQQVAGYTGGIPRYTAVRERIPYEEGADANRRPGSAGRRYFTDTVYAQRPEQQVPTLAQAQQQVGAQRDAILGGQQYNFDRPVIAPEPPAEGGDGIQSQLTPQMQQEMLLLGLLQSAQERKNAAEAAAAAPTTPDTDTGTLIPGGPVDPNTGTGDTNFQVIQPTGAMWHYNAQGELVNEVPSGTVYKVHVGDGNFDSFVDEAAARARANEIYGEGSYAQGGRVGYYLGGMTDGMADEIPATIEGRQEAALSDGEFVVPADVVSHLGNGNSNAGAQQLYDMMEKIRMARTGNPQQGKQVNPKQFLPAGGM